MLLATDDAGNDEKEIVAGRILTDQDLTQKGIDEVEDLGTAGALNQVLWAGGPGVESRNFGLEDQNQRRKGLCVEV